MKLVSRLNLQRNPSNFISDDNDSFLMTGHHKWKYMDFLYKWISFVIANKQTNRHTNKQTNKKQTNREDIINVVN